MSKITFRTTANRYAIAKSDEDGTVWYWTDRRNVWNKNPQERDLLNAEQVEREFERLRRSLGPRAVLIVADIITKNERATIYGPAFRAAIAGKERTPENLAAAKLAGQEAVLAAGFAA
jgi:hypothetical protein